MNIDAFILVGGKSSRLGRDKAMLPFDGTTLVERTAATIRKALPPSRITLVAANDTQLATSLALTHHLPLIFDIYKDRGPLGAVHAALCYARTDWAFIIACDFPFVSSDLLVHLTSFISNETDAIAPVQPDGNVQPLCSLWRVDPCLPAFAEILQENRRPPPVRKVMEQLRTRFVRFDKLKILAGAGNFFLNVNTPAELRAASALLDNLSA